MQLMFKENIMAKQASNTTGASKTAKGSLADMLAQAVANAPAAAAKQPKAPRATFTVTQLGEARVSSSGKTVLVAVRGETDSGATVGGTLWIKP